MTTSVAARISPGDRRAVGSFNWAFAQLSGLVTGTTAPNLFLVLGRHRRLFRGWLRFAGRLMPGGTLPRRDTEVVILRVAHLCGCDYEFEHHRRLGARVGVGAADVARVVAGPDEAGWSPRQRALLVAVDELHRTHDLTDATWSLVREHLDERGAIELVLLAAHYEMLATAITTLRVPPDRARRGRRG